LLDDGVAVIGVNTFLLPEKQGLNFAISVGEVKRFLEMRGNREGKKRKEESNPSPENPCKGQRQFPSFIDSITKKPVVPYDTLCLGRANVWRVGEPPEYLLWDYVGDGKIDIKIVYKFAPDVDLWIAYGSRDEVPTMFGYEEYRRANWSIASALFGLPPGLALWPLRNRPPFSRSIIPLSISSNRRAC
jgi:hypothetical protein